MKVITGIKETCLYIRDLEGAKEFYGEKLDFSIIHYAPERHIFFRVGRSVLLCFNPEDSRNKESPPPHFAEGNQHFAFEVTREDYLAAKELIQSRGIPIIDKLIWGTGQESFYFHDHEKNVLEIVPEGVWDS